MFPKKTGIHEILARGIKKGPQSKNVNKTAENNNNNNKIGTINQN